MLHLSSDPEGGIPETFDETALWESAMQRVRRVRKWGWVIGPLLVAGGALLLAVFNWGPGSPTFGERVDPFALIGFGGFMIATLLFLPSETVLSATVDDVQVRLTYSGGKVVSRRWNEPGLAVTLLHVVRGGTGTQIVAPGWILTWLGGGRRLSTVITLAAGDGLTRRAHRLGLAVTTSTRPGYRGTGDSRFEEIAIRGAGSEWIPEAHPGFPI
jgi:hypothetical protein